MVTLQAYQATGKARIIGKGREVQAKQQRRHHHSRALGCERSYDNYDESQPNAREFIGFVGYA